MSPELIAPEQFGSKKSRPTKTSDCYALGMVIYEIISGNLPFHEHADLAVFVKVLKGDRPTRRARFTNDLWKMLESCWTPQPNDRPSIGDVLRCLEAVSISSEGPLGVDEETEGYSDQDSGSSSFSVGYDCDANAGSVPDLSRLSVGPFIQDSDIDMDVMPTLPPPLSPPMPPYAKVKPRSSHQVYGNANIGVLSAAPTEGVASGSGNSGLGTTTDITNPTRGIVTREFITHMVQKTKHVSSADGQVPGTSNPSKNTTNTMPSKGVNEETDASLAAGGNYGTMNTPLWKRVMSHLPSVSFFPSSWYLFCKMRH